MIRLEAEEQGEAQHSERDEVQRRARLALDFALVDRHHVTVALDLHGERERAFGGLELFAVRERSLPLASTSVKGKLSHQSEVSVALAVGLMQPVFSPTTTGGATAAQALKF